MKDVGSGIKAVAGVAQQNMTNIANYVDWASYWNKKRFVEETRWARALFVTDSNLSEDCLDAVVNRKIAKNAAALTKRINVMKVASSEVAPSAKSEVRSETS